MKTFAAFFRRVGAPGALFALCFATSGMARAAEPVAFRRYALVLSSNDGGAGRTVLRFADSDAGNVSRVLESLGGVEPSDLIEVKHATRSSVKSAFADLKERLRPISARPRPRAELFVYYSGHSDEEGLLLGSERVSYRELRTWIEDADADVRIAILDSCASGALVRLRGGVHRPPFLSDVSAQTRGHAYLTASSADEAAQESDRIGSAFFTYYLLSGLRGAADSNRDRRVTLNEAYHFAYSETLRRTEGSLAGAQHPAYDIQLAGTGDLVITDLRAPRARLVLPERLAGRIYVRDDVGRLVAELRKEPTYPVELGLEPGNYRVVLDKDGRAAEATVALLEGGTVALGEERFTSMPTMVATVRGDGPEGGSDAAIGARATPASGASPTTPATTIPPGELPLVTVPFDIGIWPSLRKHPGQRVRNNFVLGLLVADSDELDGLQLSLLGAVTEQRMRGLQLSDAFNLARGTSEGVQISSGVNISAGTFSGVQVAPINVAAGYYQGPQVGVVNVAHTIRPEGSAEGNAQGSGNVPSAASPTFVGTQVGVVNVMEGTMKGTKVGVVNANLGDFEGLNVGVINANGHQKGASIGVVNVSREHEGFTLGVVNVAKKQKGFSLGLVNIADEVDGESLGFLFTWATNGLHHAEAFATDIAPFGLGFKTGSRHLYTTFEFAYAPGTALGSDQAPSRSSRRYVLGVGFGWRGSLSDKLFLDGQLVSEGVHNSKLFETSDSGTSNTTLAVARLTMGWRVLSHLAVVAGPSFNVAVGWNNADLNLGPSWATSVHHDGDTTVRMYPGFIAGLEL